METSGEHLPHAPELRPVAPPAPISRRLLLIGGLGAGGGLVVACGGARSSTSSASASSSATMSPTPAATSTAGSAAAALEATPTCADGDEATLDLTEGPYFTPDSPEKTDLFADVDHGTKLTLSGFVLTAGCLPVPSALVDFWHADADGEYDNSGYRLRGHQFTDAQGRYRLTTVVPGLYTGRTRHIHVKVQAPGDSVLTTQLFWPDEPDNAVDSIYRVECEIDLQSAGSHQVGTFDFVV